MFTKVLGFLVVILGLAMGYVAMQPSDFQITREIRIKAPPHVIFRNVNDLHKFDVWNAWSKTDPEMKRSFAGSAYGMGAIYKWDGNMQVGKGTMTIIESVPYSKIRIQMDFEEPFQSSAISEFNFRDQSVDTSTSWTLSGESAFIPKVMGTFFINMDRMIGEQFEKGLSALKTVAEDDARKQ